MDLAELSNEELLAIVAKPQVAKPEAQQDLSTLSNEELLAIVRQKAPDFDPARFDIEPGPGDQKRRMGPKLSSRAKDIGTGKNPDRRRPGRAESALIGGLDWAGMNYADEVIGGLQTGMDLLEGNLGDESLAGRYSRRKKRYEDLSDDAWQDHPGYYAAGAVPGFVASAALTPTIRGASAAATGLKTGALWGGVSGFGEGDGLNERIGNAVVGTGVGGVGGAALGKGGEWFGDKMTRRAIDDITEEAAVSVAQADAGRSGIRTMTRGQLTGDVGTLAKENSIRDVAYGDKAARIANDKLAQQGDEIYRATDGITERLAGVDPATGQPRMAIEQPNEAGEVLKRSVEDAAAAEQRRIEAGNNADALLAQQGAGAIETGVGGGTRRVGNEFDVGQQVGEGVRDRQRGSAEYRDAAYENAGRTEGVIDRAGVEGMAHRIREDLTYGRTMPVVINERTPSAISALNIIDDVANFRGPRNKADPLGTPNPDDVVGITPQGIETVRKQLVALSQQASAAARRGDASDSYAMRAVMEEFDNQLERIMRLNLFEGDPRWLDLYREARGLHRQHRQTFRPDDELKTAMRDIVERDATPEQVASYLYGRNRVGDTKISAHLAGHLRDTLGPQSDEWFAIRQGAWQRLTGARNQINHDTAVGIADDIDEFISNRGRSLAENLFDPGEIDIMRRYAQGLRGMATNRRTPSDAMEQMIQLANRNVQPQELARMIVGGENKVLTSGTSGRLIETLENVFGRDSEEFSLVRQAVWRQMTTVADGNKGKTAFRLAENVNEMVNGKGRPTAERLFSPEERSEMAAYVRTLRRVAGNPNAENAPKTAARWWNLANDHGRKIMTGLGLISGGVDGGVTMFAASQAAKMAGDAVGTMRAKRLFSGQKDLSVTRGIQDRTLRIGQSQGRAGARRAGPAAGQLNYFGGEKAVADEDGEE